MSSLYPCHWFIQPFPSTLVNIFEHALICMCVMECGTSFLFVAFGCPLCVEQQGGSYNPITVVVMKDQRPRLEVRHFWHPLTLLRYQSQQLLSQAAHCAEYRKSYSD